jgi:hypothetical protein
MRFLLLVSVKDSGAPDPDARSHVEPWVKEMDGRGVRVLGQRLRPESDAKIVRVRDGKVNTTTGSVTQSPEPLAAFDLIDCSGLDEAIEIAAKHPGATAGLVEVRPLWDV